MIENISIFNNIACYNLRFTDSVSFYITFRFHDFILL